MIRCRSEGEFIEYACENEVRQAKSQRSQRLISLQVKYIRRINRQEESKKPGRQAAENESEAQRSVVIEVTQCERVFE